MQESLLSNVILPLAIVIIMVTLGMTLTLADFKRVFTQPRQVLTGLLCQLVLLPLLGFAVAGMFSLPAIYAVSIILLAASPGGATSNLIVHAADGDRALSVTLTAISNMLAWLTIPFLLSVAFGIYGGGTAVTDFPVADTMIQVAALTIVPVLIGMGIRNWKTKFAEKSKRSTRTFATVFFLLIVVALIVENWQLIVRDGPRFAPAFITLNVAALAVGFFVAKLAGINRVQATTISIETGLQNATVSITVALTILNNNEMAIIPGLYALWMLASGFLFALWLSRTFAKEGMEEAAA
ncbi:MAG TPA: bile acid:sodium symporter family protein [Anaerolineales bacterium]|nr:bile acid:sodium symporter family protein [Anaerolineales bacterium]